MTIIQQTKTALEQHHLSPDLLLHQNFCVDDLVLHKVVAAAELKKTDLIFEIGTGTGILTRMLTKEAKGVISVEKDKRLKPLLHDLPKNVELIFADALQIIPAREDFNKIVANIPYQVAEPLLKILCTAKHIERTVLMVPKKFAVQVQEHPFFSAFFDFKIVAEVPKEAFYPSPKVASAILVVTSKKEIDESSFLRQQLFLQRDKKLKNALREALIVVAERKGSKLSKKEAKKEIEKLHLPQEVLEELVERIKIKTIEEITKVLT